MTYNTWEADISVKSNEKLSLSIFLGKYKRYVTGSLVINYCTENLKPTVALLDHVPTTMVNKVFL